MSAPSRPSHPLPPFDSPQQEAYLNLWRTYDCLRAFEDELFTPHGLSAQQYNALRLLRNVHPQTLPTLELASRLVTRAPDITRLVDKLERQGLAERVRPAENRRQVLVGITDKGLSLLRQLDEPVKKCHLRQLGHLSPEQLSLLVSLLKQARAPHERPRSGPPRTSRRRPFRR
ncbi:MAG: MarR family transcriptional regulator [Pirellulales bacterium]|nr:MarR family transcriptional regulator [Pirellulales bacterium]